MLTQNNWALPVGRDPVKRDVFYKNTALRDITKPTLGSGGGFHWQYHVSLTVCRSEIAALLFKSFFSWVCPTETTCSATQNINTAWPVPAMTKLPLKQSMCAECWINGHKRISLLTKEHKQTRGGQGNFDCNPSCGLTVSVSGNPPSGTNISLCGQSEIIHAVVLCLLVSISWQLLLDLLCL